ncbi:hypothetical protein FA13DRAFT_1815710 [Coprinellus micaceus]|uniref:Uncharacterized protein n=1 Tax=Coprinellus micaceus TaxID=71717 RepID=A0A4Y7T3R8_COPMI|nr:hypothetical protein FA13DRAFT_1815710 [Coprinellus micaceus]
MQAYYVLTTLAEEVSTIFPQKWSRGKLLYVMIRYVPLICIAVEFSILYRNYFSIAPTACWALMIVADFAFFTVALACDVSLGLCLGALLQAGPLYVVGIVILSCGPTIANSVVLVVSDIQNPAEQVSLLDIELGYPCYFPQAEKWIDSTVVGYVHLASTAILALVGVATLRSRYKGTRGSLLRVIRRDGGIHYLSLLAGRLISAIIRAPKIQVAPESNTWPLYIALEAAITTGIPVLAQRLLINMRKVDYVGSDPAASKLLFAPPGPGSEGDLDRDFDSIELAPAQQSSGLRHSAVTGAEGSEGGSVGEGAHNA